MLSALLGMTMALVLQQGNVEREHLHFEVICVYVGDEDSIWYQHRHSGMFKTNVAWVQEEQYNA
jgi:hypothetical protein